MSDTAPYRVRSPETWEQIKAAYLSGLSCRDCADRFDVGMTTLRDRARAEGWRRTDQPDPELLEDLDEPDPDTPARSPAELAASAWCRVDAAMRKGDAAGAERWTRLHARFAGLAAEAERQADRTRNQAARESLQTLTAIGHAAEEGLRDTQAYLAELKAAEREPHTPDSPHTLPSRLKRSMLQARLHKAIRRGDQREVGRVRAQLEAWAAELPELQRP